jgi:F420-non-reducing hydrogenase large subunit
MANRVTIDPITRLEGHGKIEIFLKDDGSVDNVFFQVPELRGFEKFCEGRPVEEMPRITTRICGVCPEAHHAASAKACDAVYGITLPPTAAKLREFQYNAFYVGDHTTHFYALAGPDFVMGPDADPAVRNIIGVIGKVGADIGKEVIRTRLEAHEIAGMLGGKRIHSVGMIPGGMSKGLTSSEDHKRAVEICERFVEFAKFTIKIVDDIVLANKAYVDLILSDPYKLVVNDMGLVDENNHVNFYRGNVRVTDVNGKELHKYAPKDYLDVVGEHVEKWSYLKFPFLKQRGWTGFTEGTDTAVFRATPLSRLNAADGMATPLAQAEYERFYATLGGKPVHSTLATNWARVIELLFAAEAALQLIKDPDIIGEEHRVIPKNVPSEGVGIVEAPRGTLTHHYITDEKGIVQKANLIVGTTNNNGPIAMSIKKAAQGLIKAGAEITEPILNMVEMAFRAYDPCFGCATHSLPGQMPIEVILRDSTGKVLDRASRF